MLITLATIACLTLIVYFLANQVLRIAIGLKPLLVCAVCAVLISIVLPRMVVGVMGLAGTLGVIMVCAAFFAYLIAYHYDKQPTTVNEAALEEAMPFVFVEPEKVDKVHEPSVAPEVLEDEVVEVSSDEEEKTIIVADADEARINSFEDFLAEEVLKMAPEDAGAFKKTGLFTYEQSEDVSQSVIEEAEIALPENDDAEAASETDVIAAIESESDTAVQEEISVELLQETEESSEEPDSLMEENDPDDVSGDAFENEPVLLPEILLEDAAEEELLASIAPILDEITVVETEKEAVSDEFLSENALLEVEEASVPEEKEEGACHQVEVGCFEEDDIHGDGEEALQAKDDRWEMLDVEELWDTALMHKEEKCLPEALGCLRTILRKYPENELVALAAVEAANILKNDGLYDEAIRLFSEARSLPAIQEDAAMEQEFVSAIAYLRIVKNILVQNRLGFLPFRSIPQEISQEIELEFREWRKLA